MYIRNRPFKRLLLRACNIYADCRLADGCIRIMRPAGLPLPNLMYVPATPAAANENHVIAYTVCTSGVVVNFRYESIGRRCSKGEGDAEMRSMTSGDVVGRRRRWAICSASSEM